MATQSINGYTGQCRLQITKTAVIVSLNNGEELATWLYNCIRQFNAVDGCFSFTSGRRGPFGVNEYCFELPQKKVAEIQKKISGYTGAVFSHNQNYSAATLSASTNVSNPSKPKVTVASDRYRSESETAPSAPLSSNLYPLTNLSKPEIYQNTGIKRTVAPPLPSKDPVQPVTVHNDMPDTKYVNAMKGVPKPMPRTMKPSIKMTTGVNGANTPVHSSTSASSLPYTNGIYSNGSVTLPSHSERSQVVPMSNVVMNPVGGYSDLNRDPVEYGDMVCSPHESANPHRFFSPSPPAVNSGYSDVDYDVIRRNREMGKFSDAAGAYSDAKGKETYDVPSSLLVPGDTYDVPRSIGGKFEDVPDVYDDDKKPPSPNDLYSVPASNQQAPEHYDVLLPKGQAVSQMHIVPDQIYDNPSKPPLSNAAYDHGIRDSLYDTPQSNQPVVGGHEMYDVVPSRKAYSYSPQPQVVEMPSKGRKPGYENIGPHGEILGELVADQLRQELLTSLNGGDKHWTIKPLRNVNSNFSRSCDFLNTIGQEPSKRFSSSTTYRRSLLPEQKIAQGAVPVSPWHTFKLHRRMSGSLGDIPAEVDSSDDGTYVVLNKTEKPNIKLPLSASNPASDVATHNINGVEDDGDMYIAMNRSPSHSTSSITDPITLPKGYIRMNTAKEALMAGKSSSIDMGGKEISPTNNRGKRSSDLVWPSNSRWSQWNPPVEPSRKSSGDSDVFSPPPFAPVTDNHPIVVAKPSARAKRSILLKGVSPQPAGQEKRAGE